MLYIFAGIGALVVAGKVFNLYVELETYRQNSQGQRQRLDDQ